MKSNLILELAKRDFTERYAGSVLGIFWAFIWPFVMIAIYTLVFSRVMGAKLPGISSIYSYSIYLIAGLLPWTAFSNTVIRASTVFLDKRNLISKVSMTLPRLPMYVVISETVTFVVSMLIYFLFMLVIQTPVSYKLLLLVPFIYVVQQIFAFAIGFLCATLSVFLHDLRELVNIIIQLWFWFTPIVYMKELLPPFAQRLLLLNPATYFIDAYHSIFFFNQLPDFRLLILLTIMGHVLLLLSYTFFKKLEKEVRDFL